MSEGHSANGLRRIAIVRQRYTHGGGAERIIERAIDRLRANRSVEVTVLARRWPEQSGIRGIRLNPPYLGRTWRDASFAAAAEACMRRERFDLVQSHERITGATVFRAGDGVQGPRTRPYQALIEEIDAATAEARRLVPELYRKGETA